MVSRVEEAMKMTRAGGERVAGENMQKQKQKQVSMNLMHCTVKNKFKRSISNLEHDAASSAIFFLACIAFAPSS